MPRHHDWTGVKRRRSVNSTTASHHSAARVRSARPSQTTSVVQQASPQASGSLDSPPSATVIASSSSATPSSTRPWRTTARPSWASAMHSTSGSASSCATLERGARVALGVGRIGRALGLLDRQPAELGTVPCAVEQPPRPRQPARRGRVLAVDAVLAGQVGRPGRRRCGRRRGAGRRRTPRGGGRSPASRSPSHHSDWPEPVERLGIARLLLERGRERVARGRPVGVGEVLPACC